MIPFSTTAVMLMAEKIVNKTGFVERLRRPYPAAGEDLRDNLNLPQCCAYFLASGVTVSGTRSPLRRTTTFMGWPIFTASSAYV